MNNWDFSVNESIMDKWAVVGRDWGVVRRESLTMFRVNRNHSRMHTKRIYEPMCKWNQLTAAQKLMQTSLGNLLVIFSSAKFTSLSLSSYFEGIPVSVGSSQRLRQVSVVTSRRWSSRWQKWSSKISSLWIWRCWWWSITTTLHPTSECIVLCTITRPV